MKYIKQLDSLRAIAVCLVIFSHWVTIKSIITSEEIGAIGVDIFFVLSGFLITRILLDNRIKAETQTVSSFRLIKNFYLRRTLRIFPIYYLTIFLLLIFQKAIDLDIQSVFAYFVTYTSNFYFFKIGHWYGIVSHLWSLAVEEQFYLIWPWIILFINKKYLIYIILAFVMIGFLSQVVLNAVPMSNVLTFTCFDAFGLGALLAWQITFNAQKLSIFYKLTSVFALVAVIVFVIELKLQQWVYLPLRTIVSIITLWVIVYILHNLPQNKLRMKFVLNNSVLIFIGKISYGIYLYHNIIPATLNSLIVDKYLNPLLPNFIYVNHHGVLMIIENSILVITISWLSYNFIEKRFLNLKKYFEYEEVKRLSKE